MKMAYWIAILICAAVIGMVFAYTYGKSHPDEDFINNLAEKTRLETVKQYEQRIADLDKQLKVSQSAYSESQRKYETIIKKLNDIKEGKDNVKPPQTTSELYNRFTAAGYAPISASK